MAGKKTFTAGAVLTASDVNDYLMDQSVMYFGGTAARNSAIPTPTTGMTTYIGTTGTATIPQIETYTGSAWQTPYGQTLLATRDVTATSTVAFDNVFTSTYTNYIVTVSGVSVTANNMMTMRFRQSGSPISTANYNYVVTQAASNNTGPANRAYAVNNTSTEVLEMRTTADLNNSMTLSLYSPQVARWTRWNVLNSCMDSSAVIGYQIGGGALTTTGQLDGIEFLLPGGSLTAQFRIYGIRNS
jgi:hypothetical protein